MATCTYCGKPAGIGSNFHVECKDTSLATPPPTAEQIEMAKTMERLGTVIQKAVFWANIKSAFTMMALAFVLGIVYAMVR